MLDRLFARPATLEPFDREFYGDFTIDPGSSISDVAAAYGISVSPDEAKLTAADFIHRRLQGAAEIGDRISIDSVELIVRALDDGGEIASIGLAVEPSRACGPSCRGYRAKTVCATSSARLRNRLSLGGASR